MDSELLRDLKGTISRYEDLYQLLKTDRDYWKERCEAAERVLNDEVNGPHTYEDGGKNLTEWAQLKNKQP